MPVEVLVFISPKPGKEKRGEEILTTTTEKIRSEEPYTLNYHWYSYQSEEENCVDYVVYGRFQDEESLEKRRELQHHKDVARIVVEEDILRKPLRYVKLEPKGGFDR